MNGHALMGRPRPQRINGIRSWGKPPEPPQGSLGLPNAEIDCFAWLLEIGNIRSTSLTVTPSPLRRSTIWREALLNT